MKLLMLTQDSSIARGEKGAFYQTLEEFSLYWERIDILCPKTEQKASQIFGNVFIHTGFPKIFQPLFILKKGQELNKKYHYDLISVQGGAPFYNDLGIIILHCKIHTPYVLELHHITGHPKAADLKEWFYKTLLKYFIKFDAKKAAAVRVVNQKQVPDFLKKAGVPEEKIKYIPSFYIDFDVFKPQDIEKKYDLAFCGRLAKNKGIFNLLEALEIIKKSFPEIKLALIGRGPLQKRIEKAIKNRKLTENVILLGTLSALEVAKILNQSKIFVMPSFNEGGPRTCLEAMACRIPVITTKVGIMVELIRDRENGLFIDWDSKDITKKIQFLLVNEILRINLGLEGKKAVEFFEKKEMIKNYALSYQRLVK